MPRYPFAALPNAFKISACSSFHRGGSVCIPVHEHSEGLQNDREFAKQGPVREIFQVGPQSVLQVSLAFRRAAEPANLRKPGDAWLEGMTAPIMLINFPEELRFCG